jgi:hypothetical protein
LSSGRPTLVLSLLLLVLSHLLSAPPATAADQEGCMLCHRLELRLPSGNGAKSLKTHDSPGGSHDSLYCSDCHPDARTVPHPAPPGSALCVGECHGGTASSQAAHRNAGFGGLTEGHRAAALPGTPCRLCHRARDGKASRAVLRDRCASCHAAEAAEVARGPHGQVGGGSCVDCHPVHPTATVGAGAAKTSCAGTGCHRASTPGMASLVRHRSRDAGSPVGSVLSHGAVFFGIAAAGWILGGALTPRATRKGGSP